MRNSQRRFYVDDAIYFVTTVTHGRHPFFLEPTFADRFVLDLWFASKIKDFRLYGYTVTADHAHLLVQPNRLSDISSVIASLKRNVSRDINDLIHERPRTRDSAGDDSNRPLPESTESMKASIEAMKSAHPTMNPLNIERHCQLTLDLRSKFSKESRLEFQSAQFRWQKSFYDHVVRDEKDFLRHLEYICGNAVKHKLTSTAEDWRWKWVFGEDEPIELR